MSSEVLKARSALGVATRSGDAQKIKDARRNLTAVNIEAYLKKVVSEAPPLTKEQLDRIAVILRPAPDERLPTPSKDHGQAPTNPMPPDQLEAGTPGGVA